MSNDRSALSEDGDLLGQQAPDDKAVHLMCKFVDALL